MEITSDSASINAPMVGKVTFEITEREEPKLIKLEAKDSPPKRACGFKFFRKATTCAK